MYVSNKQLSIYDEPEPKVVIVESPTKLEEQVYIAQKLANETLEEGKVQRNRRTPRRFILTDLSCRLKSTVGFKKHNNYKTMLHVIDMSKFIYEQPNI